MNLNKYIVVFSIALIIFIAALFYRFSNPFPSPSDTSTETDSSAVVVSESSDLEIIGSDQFFELIPGELSPQSFEANIETGNFFENESTRSGALISGLDLNQTNQILVQYISDAGLTVVDEIAESQLFYYDTTLADQSLKFSAEQEGELVYVNIIYSK